MSSWIRARAEQIKQQEQDIDAERKWEIHKSERLLAHRLDLWKAILSQVKSDAEELNRQFSGDSRKRVEFIEIPSHTFTLRKSSFPAVTVTVHISPDGRKIEYKTAERMSLDSASSENDDSIIVDLDPIEQFTLAHGDMRLTSYHEASQLFFDPILKSYEMG
jgi:hypothetical protein